MRKKMHKIMSKIASMRKMMQKIMGKMASMRKMMCKMKIWPSEGENSRSEQHKTFKCDLLAQNIHCLSN